MNLVSLISRLFSAWSEQMNTLKSESDHIISQPEIHQRPPVAHEMKPKLGNVAEKNIHCFVLFFFSHGSWNLIHIFHPSQSFCTSWAYVLVSWKKLFSHPGMCFSFSLIYLRTSGTLLYFLKDTEQASFL